MQEDVADIVDDFDRTAIGTHITRAFVVAALDLNSSRSETSVIRKVKAGKRATRA